MVWLGLILISFLKTALPLSLERLLINLELVGEKFSSSLLTIYSVTPNRNYLLVYIRIFPATVILILTPMGEISLC